MLTVSGLTRSHGRTPVLAGVDLRVGTGETVGLLGAPGSGTTTVARCLTGLERPDGGTIRWNGNEPGRSARREIQLVAQDPRAALDPHWTVRRSLREPLDTWFHEQPRADRDRRAAALLARVGLPAGDLHRYPHELSTAQCRLVCIARALAPEPRLLVLDEPLAALDAAAQARLLNLLHRLQAEARLSYLVISHDVATLAELCPRVVVLAQGRIVDETSAVALPSARRHPAARTLAPMLR